MLTASLLLLPPLVHGGLLAQSGSWPLSPITIREAAPEPLTSQPAGAEVTVWPLLLVPLMAAILTTIFTPLCIRAALRLGIVDRPDHRKRHGRVVPYTGGVAMLGGWLIALVLHHQYFPNQTLRLAAILAASVFICAVGLWDDAFKMRAKTKFFAQVAAALLLFACGVGHSVAGSLFNGVLHNLGLEGGLAPWLGSIISLPIVLLIIVGACNAANLIDGLDGLCGGITTIMAAGMVYVSWTLVGEAASDPGLQSLRLALAFALLGVTAGFLSYNSPPAKVFMGDAGSLFIGLNTGVLMILMCENNAKWFIAALMFFGLPIMDTAMAILRRWRNGVPIFSPDNWHLHHLLIRRGLSVRQAIWAMYLMNITFALIGCVVPFLQLRFALVVLASFVSMFLLMALLLGIAGEGPTRQFTEAELTQRGALGVDVSPSKERAGDPQPPLHAAEPIAASSRNGAVVHESPSRG